ncbi:MAG: lipoate--protein ligase, partial [Oscillospiraceae bacterium]|nr:lipoate--protein ligase [Oscillospiraceae bacterium]
LAELGVHAEINGRNDITIDGKKFSGNSQYIRQGRVMHHGTILFDSNLDVVSHALRVDPTKIRAKGVSSVRSRVTNVREHLPGHIDLPTFRAVLLRHILAATPGEPYTLTADDLAAVEELRRTRYAAYEWNFGTSPRCTLSKRRRVEGCGTVEVYLTVERGLITDAVFRGDFFSAVEPEELARHLIGLRPMAEDYARTLDGVDVGRYFTGLTNEQFLEILCE